MTTIPIKGEVYGSLREDFCRDSFHDKFAIGKTRDTFVFHFSVNSLLRVCLGCHVMCSEFPEGAPKPDWLESAEVWQEQKFISAGMVKKQKKGFCALCKELVPAMVNLDGIKLCQAHADVVEGKL